MSWIILIFAGLMEVGFTFCLGKTKTAAGYEQALWWLGFLCALALSMFLMAKAAERLPIGTVYPVWTGIGAVGAVVVGILFLTNLLLSGESFHYNIDSIDYRTESNGLIWKGK